MTTLRTTLNTPAVKALVTDFILTLTLSMGVLSIAPASFQELIGIGDVLAFAVFKAGLQAGARGILKWASAD